MVSLFLYLSTIGQSYASDVLPQFNLVGLYDMATIMNLSKVNGTSFHWVPSKEMNQSCGNAKFPYKMNIMEADAISSGMTPALVVLLRREGAAEYIDRQNNPCSPDKVADCRVKPVLNTDINIGLGISTIDFDLQPMVNPRYLALNLQGDYNEQSTGVDDSTVKEEEANTRSLSGAYDTSRYEKLVKTQLELELCLEHKVGRGWLGGNTTQLRQAFLLDPPEGKDNDRKFFNGQRDPVPALIGNPDACILPKGNAEGNAEGGEGPQKGKNDIEMTPSDIWGAALPICKKPVLRRPVSRKNKTMPLQLSENGVRMIMNQRSYWSRLDIDISSSGPKEENVQIEVQYNGRELLKDKLFPKSGSEPESDNNSMLDILANVPYTYPTVGTKNEPNAYVALIIPNWQIVEGLRRMYSHQCEDTSSTSYCRCEVKSLSKSLAPTQDVDSLSKDAIEQMYDRLRCSDLDGNECRLTSVKPENGLSAEQLCYQKLSIDMPMLDLGGSIFDGVGWVLQNPQHLFVQVPTKPHEKPDFYILDELPWRSSESVTGKPNVMDAVGGASTSIGLRNWGYTVGSLSGRSPIVSLGEKRLSWGIAAETQRSKQHSYFIVAVSTLFLFLLAGIRRWPDFWSRTPQERAYYWPGRQAKNEQDEPEGVDVEGAEGEEMDTGAGGEE
ncbi:MAG: hypothetical protein VX278_01805 [Myxococcota bacterium]|nr:hypothetical protein [Myxococcota bacterium]